MKRCISSSRRLAAAFFAVAAMMFSGSVFAQTVDQVLQADQRRLNLAQQSQERINNIVEGTRSLEDQYRAINKEIDGLKVYNRLMRAQVDGQQATLDDIALSMDRVDVINRQIFPRAERMQDLKEIMERSDVTVAEKFRKVMEAYQIENDYGTSSEHYTQSLTIDGATRSYNMLRIGRIGLYFQSDDTKITGRWNNEIRDWEVDNSARNEVRKGLRMARQLIAPELIVIPVEAPEA
jgi:predicted RNase H-like nuclease (RuvC/YqgF family)